MPSSIVLSNRVVVAVAVLCFVTLLRGDSTSVTVSSVLLLPTTDAWMVVPSFPNHPQQRLLLGPSISRATTTTTSTTTMGPTTTTTTSSSSTTTTTTTTQLGVVWDPLITDSGGLVDFPTSSQRIELKKEAQRRIARKELVSYTVVTVSNESTTTTPTTMSEQTIIDITTLLLQGNEMLLLKGISKDNKKAVFTIATQLCETIEQTIMRMTDAVEDDEGDDDEDDDDDDEDGLPILPVALLYTKGHTALLYCPTLPMNHPQKFILRTSVGQKNVWTARVKAPRDHRGQIIKDMTTTTTATTVGGGGAVVDDDDDDDDDDM
jgi:hypothetical protein